MPIQAKLTLDGHIISLPDITAGLPASMTDHDPTNPHIVVIACDTDDIGGYVARQEISHSTLLLNKALRSVESDALQIEATIDEHGTYERSLTTTRGVGMLALRHYIK